MRILLLGMALLFSLDLVAAAAVSNAQPARIEGAGDELPIRGGRRTRFVEAQSDRMTAAVESKAATVKRRAGASSQAGRVFYRDGVVSDATRYITTGRVIVRFGNRTDAVDLDAFALMHGLRLLRVINARSGRALFCNESDKNDIQVVREIMLDGAVRYAEPDWVLPLRLY